MKTVLITGASSGIGQQTTKYFSQNGWHVIATMTCFDHGKETVGLPNVSCYIMDVGSPESITAATAKIIANHKTIDVIINNAGIGYRSFVELSEDEKMQHIVDVNWLGVVRVCRAFIPVFREQQYGQFINISSIAGLVNLPLGSFYHATKKAVESFSECMSYELLVFNISVSTVQFGNAPTAFQSHVVKSETGGIPSYERLMLKINEILHKKTKKNTNLTPLITKTLFDIANNPRKNFTRYTIGFDANVMNFLRSALGYKLFNRIIRKSVLE